MPHSLPVSRTIRENAAALLTFSFSRRPLEDLVASQFDGEFKSFREAVFEFSTHKAERAALELALLLRYFDDEQHLSEAYAESSTTPFGFLHLEDGSTDALTLRDAANKIIHAESLGWDTSAPNRPLMVCVARAGDRSARKPWRRADVDVLKLCVACASLL